MNRKTLMITLAVATAIRRFIADRVMPTVSPRPPVQLAKQIES